MIRRSQLRNLLLAFLNATREPRAYIQSDAACFQAQQEDLRTSGRRIEAGNCVSSFLHIHRTVQSEPRYVLTLQRCLYQVQETSELREDYRTKTRVLVVNSTYAMS